MNQRLSTYVLNKIDFIDFYLFFSIVMELFNVKYNMFRILPKIALVFLLNMSLLKEKADKTL